MILRTNRIVKDSKSNGPLTRYTIWVQGCSIRCKGCNNTDTWNSDGGYDISIETIVKDFKESGSEGITITGGEPLDQFDAILNLSMKLFHETSIMLCSGRTYEEIKTSYPFILNFVDILVSGPYIQEQRNDNLLWKGSENQKVHFLTQKGQGLALVGHEHLAEVRINKRTGEIITTGFSIPSDII